MPAPEKIEADDLPEHGDRADKRKGRRWATRVETMLYGRIGSTTLNEWMRDRKIVAKKAGVKVVIDLDSLDDYLDSLPDAADTKASANTTA